MNNSRINGEDALSQGDPLTARTRPAMRLDVDERKAFKELCKTVDPRLVGSKDNLNVCLAARLKVAIERSGPADVNAMQLQRLSGLLEKIGLSPSGRRALAAIRSPPPEQGPRDNPFLQS